MKPIKRLRVGMKVKIVGQVNYGQDMQFWRGDFPGIIFMVTDIWKERIVMQAPGYGERGNYGNGKIYLSAKCRSNLRKAK